MSRPLTKSSEFSPVALGSHRGIWNIDVPAALEEVLAPGYLEQLGGRVLAGDRLLLACGPEGDRVYGDAVVVEAVERQGGEPARVVAHLLSSTCESTRPVAKK